MVCIEKRPHKMRGRSLAPNFIYLTCLLDRGHIKVKYSTSKKFKKGATVTKKIKRCKFAITKIRKNKKYYVKARAYTFAN